VSSGAAAETADGASGGAGDVKRLVLEGSRRCGLKLLMSGGGHCNITHEGNMRDLLGAYGDAGKALRTVLYKYGNRDSMQFLEQAVVPLYADESGRVLPVSMQAQDVLDAYLKAASQNGFAVCREERVSAISEQDSSYCIHTESHSFLTRKIVIATGGTSDIPVAEEAALTAEFLGNEVLRLYDVGVAGIHRLLAHKEMIFGATVIIAVAGMEGALASVVGGLADCPVIAVPTSVGYGAAFGGLSALLSMLNSCASGVSVVNIDNGFGAGYMASMINHVGTK
jgi:NCAIR mutase (PurE)-related protein